LGLIIGVILGLSSVTQTKMSSALGGEEEGHDKDTERKRKT